MQFNSVTLGKGEPIKNLSVAIKRKERLFNKNTGLCKIVK